MLKLLTKGNQKLDKTIFCWSITPVKSCLNCKDCKDTCYAVRPYKRYPNVKTAWDRNLELAKSGEFVDHIVDQLKRARVFKGNDITYSMDCSGSVVPFTVRIHVSGDFFSQEYIDNWVKICQKLSSMQVPVKFYTYTKVYDKFDFSELERWVNVINSITPLGINFGDKEYCDKLYKLGYRICPATQGHDVVCGGRLKNSCNICQTVKKVCFVKH
jgi:hypothetical protein